MTTDLPSCVVEGNPIYILIEESGLIMIDVGDASEGCCKVRAFPNGVGSYSRGGTKEDVLSAALSTAKRLSVRYGKPIVLTFNDIIESPNKTESIYVKIEASIGRLLGQKLNSSGE